MSTGWIENAIQRGLTSAEDRRIAQQTAADAKAAFSREIVNETAVQEFLHPFEESMVVIEKELEEEGFKVEDQGYGYGHYTPEPNKYALTRQVESAERPGYFYSLVYGHNWQISTPGGPVLDMVHLVLGVTEATHFGEAEFMMDKGGGRNANTPDLRQMIAASIRSHYEGNK